MTGIAPTRDFDIVVVGELNPDLVLGGDVVPEFNQVEKLVQSASLTVGSSSGIFACGAARLGLRVAFIGKVGDDDFGHFMARKLRERGVDTSGLVLAPRIQTGLTVILSTGSDRAILTFPGSIPLLRYEEIDQDILRRGRHLHVGGYFLLDALRPEAPRLLDDAHRLGLTVSVDTNYDPTETWPASVMDCLDRADVFLPNETELLAISRQQSLEEALAYFSKRPERVVAVKLGPNGAAARRGDQLARAESLKVKVVDTVGAGDSFDGGFLYGYLSGWTLERSLRMACICGSLSTTGAGGIEAQPTLQEAMRWNP